MRRLKIGDDQGWGHVMSEIQRQDENQTPFIINLDDRDHQVMVMPNIPRIDAPIPIITLD